MLLQIDSAILVVKSAFREFEMRNSNEKLSFFLQAE